MGYTPKYGRAADDKGEPSGTSGPVMIANISKYWPEYEGDKVKNVDDATDLLRAGSPGDYTPETMLIRVWMRTAVRKEVTSFGTFLSTL